MRAVIRASNIVFVIDWANRVFILLHFNFFFFRTIFKIFFILSERFVSVPTESRMNQNEKMWHVLVFKGLLAQANFLYELLVFFFRFIYVILSQFQIRPVYTRFDFLGFGRRTEGWSKVKSSDICWIFFGIFIILFIIVNDL